MSLSLNSFEFLLSLGAIDPVDYSSVNGDLEYQIGDGFRCILVPINDDTVPETTEDFTVNFFLDVFGRGAVNPSVGIIDNDQIGMSTLHTKYYVSDTMYIHGVDYAIFPNREHMW